MRSLRLYSMLALINAIGLLGCGSDTVMIKQYSLNSQKHITPGEALMEWGYYLSHRATHVVDGGIRKQLLYGGVDHGTLQISYREFSLAQAGEFARAPFYQDLKYDLASSSIIAFQDIRIAIDSADQQGLLFRVLKGPSETFEATPLDLGADISGMIIGTGYEVKGVRTGSAAFAAKIQIGDTLVSISDTPILGKKVDEIQDLLWGDPDTSAEIKLSRAGKEVNLYIQRHR